MRSNESTLRVYVPSQNVTSGKSYGAWGTRGNTGGDISPRDFFGTLGLSLPAPLSAGDQVVLLLGYAVLNFDSPILIPDELNDSTLLHFFNPLDSSALSVAAGLGAITVELEKPQIELTFQSSGLTLDWQGPGLLNRAEEGTLTGNWIEIIGANPPFFIAGRDLRPTEFFRLETFTE